MIFRSPHPDIAIPDLPLTPLVLRHAESLGDKPAFIDGASGRVLTYRQLAEGVRTVAAGLARRGFGKGAVLAICAPNVAEYGIVVHAVASLGGIVTTINPVCTGEELAQRLSDAGATYLLLAGDAAPQMREAIAGSPVRETLVLGTAAGCTSLASLWEEPERALPDVAIDPEKDLIALLYSSGTSGLPKGVMLTHRNLVASLSQLRAAEMITADDVVFGILPFFHIYGLMVMQLVLSQGATLVTLPRFELTATLEALQAHRVTFAYLAPPVVVKMAQHPHIDAYDLSHLQVIHCGGAPLATGVAERCKVRLGCRLKQGYALTECYPALRVNATEAEHLPISAVGYCAPNTECKLVDPETGAELGPGQPGEIWLRGPQVMQGYLHHPTETAQVLDAAGWLRTGDVGIASEDGVFTIVDRLKELIKYKGYQVAPAELEALLLTHPAVADVAVIPSPDAQAGEVPKAVVVLCHEVAPDDLLAFVAARVAPYKKVRRIEIVAQIPKSPSGKILRRVLVERDRAAAGVPA